MKRNIEEKRKPERVLEVYAKEFLSKTRETDPMVRAWLEL